MKIQKSSMQPPKRSRRRRSTPSTQRMWTPTEESTLINGLKELCVNGRRADNGTFRPGYLMELEHYLRERHPESGLKGEPHVNSKLKFWKRSYASLSLLKGRSGLGFQYSDGTIIIDDPKEWDKFLKDEPSASNMNTKKWPLFADWEEIFGKDRATGEHAEGPLDAVEDILKSRTSGLSTDMSLGYLINVDDDEYEENLVMDLMHLLKKLKILIQDIILLKQLKMNMLEDLLMNILDHLKSKMADQRYEMSLALIVFAVIWAGVIAQESNDCTNVLVSMSPCLNYYADSSSPQFSGCCTQLSTVVDEKPECLCRVLNGGDSDLGLNINQTQASTLTTACKVQTPPASRCNGRGSASQGGSSDATSTNMAALFSFFFLFIASFMLQ
ncbi:hypothetical protein R3W88_016934 [Solanum pinnatisectum]|nr:hypothetical protein R3W88_016934 [Solanum pinnatisectum]